jgi:tripartite-type tricarboxylate transporter receptor subunit TctC
VATIKRTLIAPEHRQKNREDAMRFGAVVRLIAAILFATALGAGSAAQAQNYPNRPITLIVPFAPGGGTDVVARAMAPILGAKLGQTVVVENVSGAAGNIAAARVSRAAPDGYTLIMHNVAFALNAGFNPRNAYYPDRDFTPITMINSTPGVLVARKDFPPNSVPELVTWMKANTARLAHPGVGSSGHLSVVLMQRAVGANADFIPYRGGGPALQDIIAGHVDITSVIIGNGLEPIASGQVKAVGVLSRKRHRLLPQVPSFFEDLTPITESLFWNVLMGPPDTPRAIVDTLHAAFEETIKDPLLVEAWARTGIDLYPPEQRTPEGTRDYLRQEFTNWERTIRESKLEGPK